MSSVFDPRTTLHSEPGRGPDASPSKTLPRWLTRLLNVSPEATRAQAAPFIRHPLKTGYIGEGPNQHGVTSSAFRCPTCKANIIFVPALTPGQKAHPANAVCGLPECDSYDPHLDVSFLLAVRGE